MLDRETVSNIAPGKPVADTIVVPPDVDMESWWPKYEAWLFDDTGDVPPPPGYEAWDVNRDWRRQLEDLAEQFRAAE